MQTAERYDHFGRVEVGAQSPVYRDWATEVPGDAELVGLINQLPEEKRQPNLVFAAARYIGIVPGGFADVRSELIKRWPELSKVVSNRRTQTNEAGRCAVLLPLLAGLPQPLALIEVGASAGLCLYPDRYSYRYNDRPRLDPPDGPSKVVLDCTVTGPAPLPTTLPDVIWRAGVDLNPLDVTDTDDLRWLEALVWPGQDVRRQRLADAAAIVGNDPPHLVIADLNEAVTTLVTQAPAAATVVVFHSAVLTYLDVADRVRFRDTVRGLPVRWISNEGPAVLSLDSAPPPPPPALIGPFLLALDGTPVAYTGGHGQALDWLL